MYIDTQLKTVGDSLISRINYDINSSYSIYNALKLLIVKRKHDIKKLNKVLR